MMTTHDSENINEPDTPPEPQTDGLPENDEARPENREPEPGDETGAAESRDAAESSVRQTPDADRRKAEQYLNQLQRLQAEFDNFRKREEKLRAGYKDYIAETLLLELLPVVDSFERAMESLDRNETSLESFAAGMKLVFKQFEDFLKRKEVKRMEALGTPFDPAFHDAVSKTPSDRFDEDLVCQVLQNGWTLKDRVLRHAMVVVSAGKSETDQTEEENNG